MVEFSSRRSLTKQQLFNNPTKGKLTLSQVIQEILLYLYQDSESHYRLVIGTDSHDRRENQTKITNYVSAIVVHRVGKGGRYFWINGVKSSSASLRDKIYQETLLSLELASNFVPNLKKSLNGSQNWELEIHIDIGRNGQTRSMIQEVVGMVVGSGYHAKTKPESFAASSVADKYT